MSINGVFIVSIKITKTANEIIETIIYDKNLPITVTASQDLSEFSSSKSLEKPFKRTISRLHELTSMKYDL